MSTTSNETNPESTEIETIKCPPWKIIANRHGDSYIVMRHIKQFWTWTYYNEEGIAMAISCRLIASRKDCLRIIKEIKTSIGDPNSPVLEEC